MALALGNQYAPQPLAITRPSARRSMISTILVAIDEPQHASEIIAFASELGGLPNASFVVVHVREWILGPGGPLDEGAGLSESRVHQVVEQLAAAGLRARGAVKGGYFRNAGQFIVDVAAAEGADMVIVGSTRAPDLRGIAFGSVPLDVLKLSVVPVAVVPVG
jgi:nucleotide-binding universal stress UspA family protein